MEQRIREQREAARERQRSSRQRLREDGRQNIRNYNSAFDFASFGANIRLPPGRGPYCFHLLGQTTAQATSMQMTLKREDTASSTS
ncbi:hypothetical protein FHG87_016316 [Trinorchestia longiramus]|nr:hypothetical protein FHG87_016316 [Trinorchestia longiramus]